MLSVVGLLSLMAVVASGILLFEQWRITEATTQVALRTVPDLIQAQHTIRNLERLRHCGDLLLGRPDKITRSQAVIEATLLSSHPTLMENPVAAPIIAEALRRILELDDLLSQDGAPEPKRLIALWQPSSDAISAAADSLATQTAATARTESEQIGIAARHSLSGIALALGCVALLLAGGVVLMRSYLLRPIQRIVQALDQRQGNLPARDFPPFKEIDRLRIAAGELGTALAEVERLAMIDELSGLHNRRAYYLAAKREFDRFRRYGRTVSLLMFDLDYFKHINDHHGHEGGDRAIVAFARLLAEALRSADFAARIGGEEFVLLAPELDVNGTAVLAERLRLAVSQLVITSPIGESIPLTVSIGVSWPQGDDTDMDAAMRRADEALYAAKNGGRNRVVLAKG